MYTGTLFTACNQIWWFSARSKRDDFAPGYVIDDGRIDGRLIMSDTTHTVPPSGSFTLDLGYKSLGTNLEQNIVDGQMRSLEADLSFIYVNPIAVGRTIKHRANASLDVARGGVKKRYLSIRQRINRF